MSTFSTASARTPREAPRVGSYRRGSRVRTTRAGTWFPALGPADEPAGLLLLHPAVKPGVLEPTISQLAEMDLPGVLPMLPELIDQAGRNWLVATAESSPTLADLLDEGPHSTPPNAAALLTDVATTLTDVHAAGLAHGSVGAHAVVLGSAGEALLTDWGTDGQASPDSDLEAWVELAQLLAERWCADSVTGAAVLARAVQAAGQHGSDGGLPGALAQLEKLAGQAQRDALVQAAARPPAPARGGRARQAPAPPTRSVPPDTRPTRFPRPTPTVRPRPTPAARPEPPHIDPPPPDAGYGEPPEPPQYESSPSGSGHESPTPEPPLPTAAHRAELPLPPRTAGRPAGKLSRYWVRGRPVLLALLLAVVLIGAVAAIIQPFGAPRDNRVAAAPAGPLEVRSVVLNSQVKSSVCVLIGTITTNGQPGWVVYRWIGENGTLAIASVSTAAYSYQVEVGLLWSPGSPPLRGSSISLQIIEPKPSSTPALVPLSCI